MPLPDLPVLSATSCSTQAGKASSDDEATKVGLPPWLAIDREVTDDANYSNYVIAG